jgi:PIN domain nuclease of toxin-antitoxin system
MMVLDTHVWIRWVDPTNMPLPAELVERIETSDQLAISAISCWELAMLVRRGRVQVSLPLDQWIDIALSGSGVTCLPVERQIAICAANLPEHHRDPADRLIIATTITANAALASLDDAFSQYAELSGKLFSH